MTNHCRKTEQTMKGSAAKGRNLARLASTTMRLRRRFEAGESMIEQLSSLYEYGGWVNQRLLETATALTDEQFTRKVLPGFGSVHLTLVHLLGAEVLWFARWQGLSPKTILSPGDVPDVPAMRERWARLVDERRANLLGLTEAELAATVQWTNMRGQAFALPRWQMILHCANHSTHHRSEIAAMLTQLGHEPDSTDLLEYYLERVGQQMETEQSLVRLAHPLHRIPANVPSAAFFGWRTSVLRAGVALTSYYGGQGGVLMSDEISRLEDRLRQAMLTGDVSALDELIADTLVFTMIDGSVLGKEADLTAHRSRTLKIASLEPSDQHIQMYDGVAIVAVRMHMRGTYAGADFAGVNRYTRVWLRTRGRWQIIAGHVSPVPTTDAS